MKVRAYVYRVTNRGKLKITVGFVDDKEVGLTTTDILRFYYEFPAHGKMYMMVSKNPREVYNKAVWSYIVDDKIALGILSEYYEKKRSEYLALANKCYDNIKIIQEEIEK